MKDIKLYTTRICPFCVQAKILLDNLSLDYQEISLEGQHDLRIQLSKDNGGWRTVPMIFIDDQFIGGYQELAALSRDGKLAKS